MTYGTFAQAQVSLQLNGVSGLNLGKWPIKTVESCIENGLSSYKMVRGSADKELIMKDEKELKALIKKAKEDNLKYFPEVNGDDNVLAFINTWCEDNGSGYPPIQRHS